MAWRKVSRYWRAHLGPRHAAAELVGVRAQVQHARRVPQQAQQALADALRVAELDQHAARVAQQLLGVPVGRGDDGLAGAERVGERAAGDLLAVQVGRHVDVGRLEELAELLQRDEPAVEQHVALQAQVAGLALQAQAVALALLAQDVRVRGAQDDVAEVGELLHDGGQRTQGVLDALARAQQPERQQHLAPLHVELALVLRGLHQRDLGHAVVDEAYLLRRRVVDALEEVHRPLAHHHELAAQDHQLVHHLALALAGRLQHGVEGGDDGAAQLAQQVQDVAAVVAAEDAELVLQADGPHLVVVEEFGRADVVGRLVLAQAVLDLRRVVQVVGRIVHRDDDGAQPRVHAALDGPGQVVGERADAALAGGIGRDERYGVLKIAVGLRHR